MESGALSGVRVLDLTHGIAGPFAARLLGDFGADVIKVEKPVTGDFGRTLEPLQPGVDPPEQSLLFQYLNWNKRSVCLDLSNPASLPVVEALVRRSDIVIESFRPGVMEGWGLSAEQMLAWNPKVVVTSISNFGQTGPYAQFAASDLVLQAMGGIMSISGQMDREPLKHGLNQSLFCAGLNAAYITMAMYVSAQNDGFGEHIDVSIQECMASELVLNVPFYAFMGVVQGRRAAVQDPFLGEPIATHHGYLTMQTGGGASIETYAEMFGREEFLSPDITVAARREANAPEVRQLLESCLRDRDAKSVFLEGASKRLLLGVVQNAQDLLSCEHLASRDFFRKIDHPDTGEHIFPTELVKLSATPMSVRRPAPRLDQHRREILVDWLGLPEAMVDALAQHATTDEVKSHE